MNTRVVIAGMAAVALCGCHRDVANQQTASDAGGTPVTLVGCLVPGGTGSQPGAVGTSGSTGAAGFTLVDASNPPNTANPPATSGTSGASTQAAAVDTTTPRSYNLIAGKQDDLQKYQNSKVEVTGLMVASTDTGTGVPDVGAAAQPAGTPTANAEQVRVNKVRQLDKSCSPTQSR